MNIINYKTIIRIITLSAVFLFYSDVFSDTTSTQQPDSTDIEIKELQRSLDEINGEVNGLDKKVSFTSLVDDISELRRKLTSVGKMLDSVKVQTLIPEESYNNLLTLRDDLLEEIMRLEKKTKPEYRKTLQEQNFRIYNLNYFSKMCSNKNDIKFQLSNAYRIFKFQFDENYDRIWFPELWLSYTGLSRWALFDFGNSSPFLQTNHLPELFFSFGPGVLEPGLKNPGLTNIKLGVMHESNVQQFNSRSWDRYFGELIFEYSVTESQYMNLYIRPWYATEIVELDPKGIEDYLGNGEITLSHIGRNFRTAASIRYGVKDIDNNAMKVPFIR
jgi:outer membrane phospholipase A